MEPISLRVLVTHEDGWWVARGIEHDIAACATTTEELQYEFDRVLMAHVFLDLDRGIQPLSDMPPAPPTVAEKWERGMTASMRRQNMSSIGSRTVPELQTEARVA